MAIHVQRCLTPIPLPIFIVVDVSWALDLAQPLAWFTKHFPVQDVITCFTKIDVYIDCNEVIWNEVDMRLVDSMDNYDFLQVEFFFENLMETFYQKLELIMPKHSDKYRYHGWLDERSLVMIHKDYEQQYGNFIPQSYPRRPPW